METLRISAPTAAAAFMLIERLADVGATAHAGPGHSWMIVVRLDAESRSAVPRLLAATREWLQDCGFSSSSVAFDGQTHTLCLARF